MDGWYNQSRRLPVWDRVKTKNEGGRATMTGGYWVRWMVGTITAREIDLHPMTRGEKSGFHPAGRVLEYHSLLITRHQYGPRRLYSTRVSFN
jgi:hypothetical protein